MVSLNFGKNCAGLASSRRVDYPPCSFNRIITRLMAESPKRKSRFDYRSKFRQRAHDEAHADSDNTPESEIPDHVTVARGNPELITTNAELAKLIDHLRGVGSFAYDTEFIGESSFTPVLCLLQIATSEQVWLVDPLADNIDITPFMKLLADESLEKILHAAEQDVEPVGRYTGQPARNVFDTQIAAGFAAMAYPTSLAKLMHELLNVKLHKAATFTHWDQRPLSPKQLRYAADDVRYLPSAAAELKKRLQKTGHLEWVQAECDALCEPTQYVFNRDTAHQRVKGVGSLEPRQINILKELVSWRFEQARIENVPARTFLRDDVLIDIARSAPKNVERLGQIRGMPRPVVQSDGTAILQLIVRGQAASTDGVETLRNIEPTPSERFAADALWAAAQLLCATQSIDPAIVASRQQIGEFYRAYIQKEDFAHMPLMQSWRKQAIGEKLLELLKGHKVDVTLKHGPHVK